MTGIRVRRFLMALLLGLFVAAAIGSSASAQEPADDEGGESARGLLRDEKGTRERDDDEPVEGVDITVSTAAGEEVDTVTTDDDGRFEIELPGPGDYVAVLDTDTLPDGLSLPEGRETVLFTVRPNQSRPLIFELGGRERSTTGKLDQVPQLLYEGLSLGLVIAIMSVGLSLIYGTTGLVNFAHSEHVTWGALVAWWLNVDHDLPLVWAAIIAVAVGGATGALADLGLWQRLRNRGMSLTAMMIVSIGMSLALRGVFQLLYGETTRPFRDYNVQKGIDIGPIRTAPKDLWVIALILVVIVGVASLLQYTRIGKAMRAVADNGDLAASSGIDVDRVIRFVWALGGALAALGGVMLGVQQQVQFEMGFKALLLMFAGITLGGLGTAYGALVGSFVVGMFIQLSTLVVPTELKNVGALLVLIVVLLFRPQGILGKAERIG